MPIILGTLHVADLWREPRMRIPTQRDWARIPSLLAGTWPEPIHPRVILTSERMDAWPEAMAFFEGAEGDDLILDTEYHRETHYLLMLGLGLQGPQGMRGLQVQWPHLPSYAKEEITTRFTALVKGRRVILQNLAADLPVLEQNLHLRPSDFGPIEDVMLAHAVLYSEWPHDLEFLASLYGCFPKMKHLVEEDALLYNWGDVLETASAWYALEKELKADPLSERVYREQSLPIALSLLDA